MEAGLEPQVDETTRVAEAASGSRRLPFSLTLPPLYFRLLTGFVLVTGIGPVLLGAMLIFYGSHYAAFINLYLVFYALLLLLATNAWLFLVTCLEGAVPAALFLVVPGYQPYFVWTRWKQSRQPIYLMAIGCVCLAAAYVFTQTIR